MGCGVGKKGVPTGEPCFEKVNKVEREEVKRRKKTNEVEKKHRRPLTRSPWNCNGRRRDLKKEVRLKGKRDSRMIQT